MATLEAGLYVILPLELVRGVSEGQGAVGVGVSIGHRQYNTCSQHSLKVTHLLSLVVVTTQQCSPSGLLCVGPRDRTCRAVSLVISRSSVATSAPAGTVDPSGNCHTTLVVGLSVV